MKADDDTYVVVENLRNSVERFIAMHLTISLRLQVPREIQRKRAALLRYILTCYGFSAHWLQGGSLWLIAATSGSCTTTAAGQGIYYRGKPSAEWFELQCAVNPCLLWGQGSNPDKFSPIDHQHEKYEDLEMGASLKRVGVMAESMCHTDHVLYLLDPA